MPLNIPYYETDIPRLVTAAADWLACLLYLRFLPPRCGGARRAALYTGAFAVLVVYLVATDGFDGWRFNVLYAVSVALMLLFMAAATRADWCQVVFFCTRAFILAGFAASLTWQMYVYFAKDNPLLQGLPALVLFIAAGFGLIFGLISDFMMKACDYKNAKREVLIHGVFSMWVIGAFIPIVVTRNAYYQNLLPGYGQEYADTLMAYMPDWILPVLLIAAFVSGLVGGLIGRKIFKKHFERAGIV